MKKKKKTAVATSTKGSLEEQALSQLNATHYKEAIGLYKKLLQVSDNSEWRQQLATCYLQRALSFAERGMVKEAIVLWENHSQYVPAPYEAYDHYIVWTILTKNQAKIQTCLAQLSAAELDKHYPQLATLMGYLLLTDHPEFQQELPQDSVLIGHTKIVESALQAFQENRLEKVNETLKQLPYRSAFRDFRTLLNAFIVDPESSQQMAAQLVKIPAHSPYRNTATMLLCCTQTGSFLIQELFHFSHKQIKIIADIKGFNKKQFEFIQQVIRQKDRLSDKVKFNLAIQYQSLCGSEMAQDFCQAMLVTYPVGIRDYKKHFGLLSAFEDNRIKALKCERDGSSYDAEYFWKQCVKILIKEEANNGLKIALILRHIALKNEDEEQVELLIESLQYDPDDHTSYLHILRYYAELEETGKDYKQWLNKTLDKFPQDVEVLSMVVRSATRKKAYKKASQYAQKILKIDTLNTFARQVLFSSHLAHARRLILSKKYHLVENEIQQAENLNIGKSYIGQIQLMRGLLCFFEQDKKQGLQLVVEALKVLNSDPINATFQATIESSLTGLPIATVLRALPTTKGYLLSDQDLSRLIQQIKNYAAEDDKLILIDKALEKIKPQLKKSIQEQDYDESLLLSWCETLDVIKHFELLRHCAKLALTKWTKPVWVYYKIYSDTNGRPEKCTSLHIFQLQGNSDRATQNKDHRAMVLIDAFLDRYYQLNPMRSFGFLDDLFDADDDDFDDPLEDLFEHIPNSVFIKINKKIESLTKKTSPEKLVNDLGRFFSDESTIMSAMMHNPEIFSALMVVKAANELAIDIDVSVNDVLNRFRVTNNSDSCPF